MINYTKSILVGLLFSGAAFGFTAEQMNARGHAIIVADVTPEPKPGFVDVAKNAPKAAGSTMGEVAAGTVAATTNGGRLGAGVAGGLLLDALTTVPTYDSRKHMYRVVYEKDCKVSPGFSTAEETDVAALVSGQPAEWIEPPSGKGVPVLAVVKNADGKPVPRIEPAHPCFAAYEAARLAEEAKRPGTAR